jgi:hypothetical protein
MQWFRLYLFKPHRTKYKPGFGKNIVPMWNNTMNSAGAVNV